VKKEQIRETLNLKYEDFVKDSDTEEEIFEGEGSNRREQFKKVIKTFEDFKNMTEEEANTLM